jgi:hypothetical protein
MPLTELICKGHFMDWLIEKGIIVEYLDLSKLYYPDYVFTGTAERHYIVRIDTYKDLKKYIKAQNSESTLFISIVTFEWRVHHLYRILTQANCKLGVFARGMLPFASESKSTKIVRLIKYFSLSKISIILKNRILLYLKKYGWIKTYDIVFLTGQKALVAIGVGFEYDAKEALIVDVNTADYDSFLEVSNPISFENQYAVFLDENLPSHPDTKLFNISPISPNDYYPELNRFFDNIEKDFNVEIVIAAHPKALNYKNSNPFNGRKILFNKTNELVANADFVIAHDSTSIGFAVMNSKPIISITNSKLKEFLPNNHGLVIAFSKYLNTSLVYYDNYKKDNVNLNVDEEKYDSYKFEFLTNKGTLKTLTKDIFYKSLKDL